VAISRCKPDRTFVLTAPTLARWNESAAIDQQTQAVHKA
jgi:hypothetical protein